MNKKKKITDKQLEKEIRKGKTEKQIAYDNGYVYPSSTLNRRIRNLGYKKNQKIYVKKMGSAQWYLSPNPMIKLYNALNIDYEKVSENPDNNLFFEIVKISGRQIVLELTENSFKKIDKS